MKHDDQGQLFLFQTVHTANGEKYDYYKDVTETEVSNPSTQTILWRYAIVDGRKTDIFDAASGDKGLCPLCGEILVARIGPIRAPHWCHKNGRNCDQWYERKGAWHRFWQDKFPKECQEVPRIKGEERHVADVFIKESGYVVECQYSSISPEKVMEREEFYGKMIWIVNGTRLKQDIKAGLLVKDQQFQDSMRGFRYCAIKSNEFNVNHVWSSRERLVVFDFDGTINDPSSGTDVFCLLTEEVDIGFCKKRLLIKMSQTELVSGLQEPAAFLNLLHQIAIEYSESDVCKKSRERFAKMTALEEERLRREECRKDDYGWSRFDDNARHPKAFSKISKMGHEKENVEFEKHHPPRYAITCDWLDLWLYLNGLVCEIAIAELPHDLPSEGIIALHNSNTCQDFEEKRLNVIQKYDLPNAWKGIGIPPEEKKFLRRKGAITAIARYVVSNNGTLQLSNVRRLDCAIMVMPDGNGLWSLPQYVKVKYGKLGIILEDSRTSSKSLPKPNATAKTINQVTPSCPLCRSKMVKRNRGIDGSPFWACSNFFRTGCKGTRDWN